MAIKAALNIAIIAAVFIIPPDQPPDHADVGDQPPTRIPGIDMTQANIFLYMAVVAFRSKMRELLLWPRYVAFTSEFSGEVVGEGAPARFARWQGFATLIATGIPEDLYPVSDWPGNIGPSGNQPVPHRFVTYQVPDNCPVGKFSRPAADWMLGLLPISSYIRQVCGGILEKYP